MSVQLPYCVDVAPVRRWLAAQQAIGKAQEAERKIKAWQRMVNEFGVVKSETRGHVGVVTLSYPQKANALVPPMYKLFYDAMTAFADDDEIRVIVITGAGKNFSSGGFVGPDAFYAGLDAGEDSSTAEPMRRTFVEMFQLIPKAVYAPEQPVICMLNGPVYAEAVDIALTSDIRTGHAGSDMGFSFARTGNTAYTGAAWSLPRLVGFAKASQILLQGETLSGTDAYAAGLMTYLFEPEELVDRTYEMVERIAGLPPITLRLIKKEMRMGQRLNDFLSALDTYSAVEPIVQFTADHIEAEQAFVEGRPAIVQGR